jgi:hypothetical protein
MLDSDNQSKNHKEHVEWVRKIARAEALKCIQEVLSQGAIDDKHDRTKKSQSK